MKSKLRKSRLTGSQRVKIEKLIRRGWFPGAMIGRVLSRKGSYRHV